MHFQVFQVASESLPRLPSVVGSTLFHSSKIKPAKYDFSVKILVHFQEFQAACISKMVSYFFLCRYVFGKCSFFLLENILNIFPLQYCFDDWLVNLFLMVSYFFRGRIYSLFLEKSSFLETSIFTHGF